jgi:hypothetical protein
LTQKYLFFIILCTCCMSDVDQFWKTGQLSASSHGLNGERAASLCRRWKLINCERTMSALMGIVRVFRALTLERKNVLGSCRAIDIWNAYCMKFKALYSRNFPPVFTARFLRFLAYLLGWDVVMILMFFMIFFHMES